MKYMLKEGRKNPKSLSLDSANYFLDSPHKARADWIIYQYPGELKADQVRLLIKQNSPKVQIALKNQKRTLIAKINPLTQIEEIQKKYPPISYLVRYVDKEGYKYNYKYGGEFRRSTGIALESLQTYSLKTLLKKGKIKVLVYSKKSIPEKRGSGAFYVEGTLIHSEIIEN